MKKVYHLASCSTCQAIIKQTKINEKAFVMQDIKTQKITAGQLEEMKKLSGTFEALFSKRAIKYKEMQLKDKPLTEEDFRKLILEEYTFLKRPVIIDGFSIFIGSEKKTQTLLQEHLK